MKQSPCDTDTDTDIHTAGTEMSVDFRRSKRDFDEEYKILVLSLCGEN
jgi:hypothetical protein